MLRIVSDGCKRRVVVGLYNNSKEGSLSGGNHNGMP